MKLKEIHRTSTFAWSPSASLPLLATGTVAGALDESFSNESSLEIWAPDFLDKDEWELGGYDQPGPRAGVKDNARFNRLAWGHVNNANPHGVIAAGLENGELALWDPAKILAGADDSLILRNTIHTGPVRGLDFNPIQSNLLASGGINGEVYIWDLKDPSKPYTPTPGSRSTKLDEITSVAWNQQVQYVLAGASSTGYTVVWDLRGKREVVALAYGGGPGTLAGNMGGGMAGGGRRGMSDIAWHPDNATRVVTASEDDSSPIIMVWDLRNARAPEKILTGHDKGILSLSWCKQDADLLLSCGKDNRALCWNPQTSEIIGELPSADNWAFQVDWCPRNPDLLATAFFDGTIGIHSIQSTNDAATPVASQPPQSADIFNAGHFPSSSTGQATFSLKQPPKWLRRPVSTTFGFGGKLVSVSNLSGEGGKNQSRVAHLRNVVTEEAFVGRAKRLLEAVEGGSEKVKEFAESKVEVEGEEEAWKALLGLFKANSREELVTLLGFSKEEVKSRVEEAVERLKLSVANVAAEAAQAAEEEEQEQEEAEAEAEAERTRQPVVSFAEVETVVSDSSEAEGTSENASLHLTEDRESTTTVPSLFGEDDGPGTPHVAGQDFFNTVAIAQPDGAGLLPVHVPHTNYPIDSSVAATIGSAPSSVLSDEDDTIDESHDGSRKGSFRIYPADQSETDKLITKAVVLGDFESAVSVCMSTERYADAILLAVRGGPELLARTQKEYFEKRSGEVPYLRLFESIVTKDGEPLEDIVKHADLREWREIFVVICTFADDASFGKLAEGLGVRLEQRAQQLAKDEDDEDKQEEAAAHRKNATLTYLAAQKLERLVTIWASEMQEDERAALEVDLEEEEQGAGSSSQFSIHADALQSFVEKVAIFRSATAYNDEDLKATASDKTFKLAALYDRYLEYAELLSTQGLLKEAASVLQLTPAAYKGSSASAHLDRAAERERLVVATSSKVKLPARAPAATGTGTAARAYADSISGGGYGYPNMQTRAAPVPAPTQSAYQPYQPAVPPAPAPTQSNTYTPYQPPSYQTPYAPVQQPGHRGQVPPPPAPVGVGVPPPPRVANGTPSNTLPPPPPKRDAGGWNDAPANAGNRPSALNLNKGPAPAPITTPLPNMGGDGYGSPAPSPYMQGGAQPSPLPPPPRPGSRGGAALPPPPQGRSHQPPPIAGQYAPQRPPSRPQQGGVHPPPRMMSPANQPHLPGHVGAIPGRASLPPRLPTPSQYAPAPVGRGPSHPAQGQQQLEQHQHHQQGPPHPGMQQQQQPQHLHQGPPNPYGPPPGQHQQAPPNPYGPPPGQQQHQGLPPPPQSAGAYGPPPQRPMSSQQPPVGGPPGGPGGPPPGGPPRAPPTPVKQGPPPPKYPPGDRSHLPEHVRPAYEVIVDNLNRLKMNTPPQQKRLVDDLERRINPLFDALNCETLSPAVVNQFIELTQAMAARDRPMALAIHVDLLTRGSQTDDIGMWMSGIKQLITRL